MKPPRALPSIRSRLTWLLVGVALAWGLLMSVAVWLAVRHELDELLDETLQSSAEVLGQLLSLGDVEALSRRGAVINAAGRHEHFAWQLVGPGGVVRLRSVQAPLQALLPLPTAGLSDAARDWRVYGLPLADGQHMLYVAQTREERDEAAAETVLAAVWTALVIAGLSAYWLRRRVRHALQPLVDLPVHLDRYEPLPPVVPLPAPSRRELQPVHQAIEALGHRLARRVANERAFSAHAAHALRTPLAGMDTQLAVAQREAPADLQPRLARAREAANRMTRVVSALLALFRSGSEPQRQPLDLPPLLHSLLPATLQLDMADAHALLAADADLLTAALINLVDNAVRHGASQLQAHVQIDAGRQRLRLHDNGRGCAPERHQRLAAALAEQHYEDRTGLGLMLADLVARAHGGRVTLPVVDHGFAIELDLGPAPEAHDHEQHKL